MLVRRSKRNHGFTVLSNETIRDPNLSLKATGLLCFLLSFPDDWQINIKHISNNKTDGQSSVQSAINELKAKGYLRKTRVVDDSGKILRWETTVFEHPDLENPDLGNPDLENPVTGNRGDILNTERRIPESKKNCRDQETTTAIFPEPTEPAPQRLTAVPSQNPLSSSSVSAAPVMQGVGSAAATRETQVETTPPRDQFGRPQRNASLVPPLHPVQVGNGTPWLPMAPWTSREEHDEFAAYLHRSFPGKPEGYYHKIIDRVGKGDFENRSWLAFKAGNSPESMGAALSIPDEWKRLLEAEQRAVSESNPQWSEVDCQLRGLNNFRGKFTYCRNGQESKLGQAADDWALGLLNALKAQSAA